MSELKSILHNSLLVQYGGWCWEQGEGSQSNTLPPSQSLTFKPFPPREDGAPIWDCDPSHFETTHEKEDGEALK